ncbi:MAG: hypothetical protein K0R65_1047 [Crocinitomicaceae bacterium]|jgi:Zn-dependent protease|nr:hypothetical protein [Crocinitomicaceae bacterium]
MKRYILTFFACALGVAAIFFLIPINLFDGEIVFEVNGVEFTEKAKISLSYFIGIGANAEQTQDVKDFYLLPMGYLIAFLMIGVLPAIITYRIYLKNKQKG